MCPHYTTTIAPVERICRPSTTVGASGLWFAYNFSRSYHGWMDNKLPPDAHSTPDVLAAAPTPDETTNVPPQGDPLDFLNDEYIPFRVQMCVHTVAKGTIQVPVICFANAQMAKGVIAQYLDMEDQRLKCQGWMMAVQTMLGSVQEGLANTLRLGGYPAMLSNRYKLVNITLAPCAAKAPWSLVVTYFFKGPDYIEPVVTFWPESLVKRTVCGICPSCDPQGKNTALAEQMRKEAETAMAEAQRRAAEAQAATKVLAVSQPVPAGPTAAEQPVPEPLAAEQPVSEPTAVEQPVPEPQP